MPYLSLSEPLRHPQMGVWEAQIGLYALSEGV